mmetsp:Transcript_38002/g.72868  ORF Transcript_38002/g.72868 Transcript_38002/m.72868 type:complete len:217 (-) Transcript_38002:415-1065(-)
MDRIPGPVCFRVKFSSANFSPQMDLPPVPLWLVKSPPWHMNPGMTLWKEQSLNPKPISPVHRARKFSHVLGTTSPRSSITTLPATSPSSAISKNTLKAVLCLTSMRFNSMSSTSKLSVSPARGWLVSKVTVVSVTSMMVAGYGAPMFTLVPTLTSSFPRASTTRSSVSEIFASSLFSPYASAGEAVIDFVSPTFMPSTPLSMPGIICPLPTVKARG